MNVHVIDIVFCGIVFFFAILGLIKGFVDMVFNKLAPILSIWGAILFYKILSVYLEPFIKQDVVRYILSFLIIFAGFFIVVKILQRIVSAVFRAVILSQLNRTLGFFMGIIEALAIIVLILFVLEIQPWFDLSALLEKSWFYTLFHSFIGFSLGGGTAPVMHDMPVPAT